MLLFDYKLGLYRRNNFGQPCVWFARKFDYNTVEVFHGILGKNIIHEFIHTSRNPDEEVKSRINAKEKVGYKHISDVKDNVTLPVEGELLQYLDKYLPTYRTTADGSLLPMLAKVYDNANNKLFNKCSNFIGQWKINGLRCFVSAEVNNGDMFKPIRLKFQSREGTYWNSLSSLEDYLLETLDSKLLAKMVDEHYILDGEVYLPGHTVNEINHFVKDATCPENKLIQYWCYDVAIDDTTQDKRISILFNHQLNNVYVFGDKEEHFNNTRRFVVLPCWDVNDDTDATMSRNRCIDLGFEGLIMRNPNAEYQYGKRNLSMIKYKKSTDGKFTIVDIYPEGIKRPDIPLLLCKNDINSATFECHLSGSQEYQKNILENKEKYIGKVVYLHFSERSGVNNLPFHIRDVVLI